MNERITILAIDDDAADAHILQRHLEMVPDMTVDFVHFGDPARGREELSRREVDLTFIDYRLGTATGLDVLQDIRASGDLRPIIVLTGQGNEYIAAEVTRAGADEYIVKSDLSPSALKQAIDHALAQYKHRQLASRVAVSHEKAALQLENLNSELARVSRIDALTGLLNRGAWSEAVILEHQRVRRCNSTYIVLMIDVDYFKRYNDALGHITGDNCLQQIAGAVTSTLRKTDIIGRYGGEEFASVLADTDQSCGIRLAEEICASVRNLRIHHPDSPIGEWVTVSVGGAVLTESDDWEDVVERADKALYVAKEQGRDRASIGNAPESDIPRVNNVERLNVLAIDDDDEDVLLLRNALEGIPDKCIDVIEASTLEDAHRLLGEGRVDVIFLDYQLGLVTGLDVLRSLRACGEMRPIIAFTGQRNDYIAAELMRAGADDYLVKSDVNPDVLRRMIELAVARHQRRMVEAENRRLLQEVRRKNASLRAKNLRLTELYETAHEFVDNVSHEFRTPLTVIKEFTSIIADGLAGATSQEQQEYLGIVLNRVDDLATMIDDMLDISKLEAGALAVCRTDTTVDKILDRIRTTIERKAAAGNVKLEISADDPLPTLYCDAEKIARVVINLTVNAIKFSAYQGTVRVWIREELSEHQVRFGVTDKGPGIDPDQVASIFERFRQLEGGIHASTRGFGLGLNIAKELVHLSFGDIEVESKLGEGSTFSFTLPTVEPVPLIARFLKRVSRCRDGLEFISLIAVRTLDSSAKGMHDDVHHFIQHQIRRCDLLFNVSPGHWLLVAASNQQDMTPMSRRLQSRLADANRNRPGQPLPALEVEIHGTWSMEGERAAFVDRFAQAMKPAEVMHA